ncbi:YraN family protein [Alphaproteobacteria bacterium HT1-32]|nr:YraN family protein [Alphaproteobacteria bacterium HT1-32]
MSRRSRRRSERAGRRAEWIAAWFLRFKGYRILARRCRTPAGEIDIIARRGRLLAFVEVKHRTDPAVGLAAVSPRQQQRIIRAAGWFISGHPDFAAFCLRFDVILTAELGWPCHTVAAFQPETGKNRLP